LESSRPDIYGLDLKAEKKEVRRERKMDIEKKKRSRFLEGGLSWKYV
jgi:hypothetical protein